MPSIAELEHTHPFLQIQSHRFSTENKGFLSAMHDPVRKQSWAWQVLASKQGSNQELN
jgi:hypothetical protein